ncbi:MAG TPA: PQQ-dependent sugar dehydrogenase [Pyrinomonadaceae bacterium]|nr:PQQ-dependent sugar dehydrogenase [Pyrinomonadaceae bacterium]
MKRFLFLLLALSVTFAAACGSSPPTGRGAGEIESAGGNSIKFRVETVVSGLEVPWSIAFAPDGRMFITERPGRVRVFENGKLRPQPVATIEDVRSASESGLMGLVLHPQFAANHLLYLSYAYAGGDGQMVRVVRYRETGDALVERQVVIENIPAAPNHAGCRLRFGPDGKLYVTTGDATDRELAQRMDSLAGKTLRLNDDGSVPSDNPFVSQQGARPEIWTLGHRNAQGLDFQPGTDLMFQTEHGPSGFDGPGGGDEVNIVERAKNYGWPIIHHRQGRAGLESPLLEYTPACAPASGTFYRGSLFQQFRGNYFFGCLRGQRLIRVVLDGRRVVSQEDLLKDSYGRIREVAEGPDGAIYFSTSNRDGRGSGAPDDDRILKLVPVK